MTTPLPPNDPPGTDDRLPGETELTALYRQLPQREPSPVLDAAVLRAAAQALPAAEGRLRAERRQSPRESGDWVHLKRMSTVSECLLEPLDDAPRMDAAHQRRRRVPHWLLALGSAASLVLVAGLAWYMRTAPTVQPAPAEPATQPQLAAAAAMQATERAETRSAAAHEAVAGQAKRQAIAPHTKVSATPPPAADVAAAPPPTKMAVPARHAAPASGKALEAKPQTIATPPAPPAAAPALQEMSATPLAAPPPAPPAPVATAQDAANGSAAIADTPAQQLARIEQLFAQGHAEEARKQLRAFHQAHPTWPLPAKLKAQLPKP